MLRVELELPSGLVIRARMTKEEYATLGLRDDMEVSLQIRQYRLLATDGSSLAPEVPVNYQLPPHIAEGI